MKNLNYIFAIWSLCLVSCIKDIDTDQLNDIEILTDHNITLVHFDIGVNSFLDDLNNERLVLTDTLRLPIFVGPYTQNFLIQADFEYVLSNSYDRGITIQYELLDIDNVLLYQFPPIPIPQTSANLNVTQSVLENEIPAVLQTDQVVAKIRLDSGSTPLDPSQPYNFNLKSGLVLHYKVTVENE